MTGGARLRRYNGPDNMMGGYNMQVGLIGLGAMGLGMARNLAKAGYLSAVYNRTAAKAEALAAELQVLASESIEQLASQVDVVLICVSADKDVLMVVDAIATIKPAGVVVDMSTVSSETPPSWRRKNWRKSTRLSWMRRYPAAWKAPTKARWR